MLKLERGDKMNRAIARAKAVHPRVKWLGNRTYLVTSSDDQRRYTVRFVVAQGHKLAECNCAAGLKEQLCYHVAAAAAVNIAIASIRRQAEQSATPVAVAKAGTQRASPASSDTSALAIPPAQFLRWEKYCGVDI